MFALLWQLPVFHSIEAPTRYFAPLVIFIIAVSAGSIFSVQEKFNTRFLKVLFVLALIFTTADLFFTNNTQGTSFPQPVPAYAKQAEFFAVKNSGAGQLVSPYIPKNMFLIRSWEWTLPSQYQLMLENIGKVNWYGNIHLKESATPKYYIEWNGQESFDRDNFSWRLNSNYKGEIYFLNNPNNKAEFQYFSPNTLIAKVNILEPDTLIINQNYDKYWRSNIAKPINYNGILAVNLNQRGEYEAKFIFVPLSFYLGLNVSLITLVFLICYFTKHNKNNPSVKA